MKFAPCWREKRFGLNVVWGVQLSRHLLHVTINPQASQWSRTSFLLLYSYVRPWWQLKLNPFPCPQLCSPHSSLKRMISLCSSQSSPSKEPSQQRVKKWGFSLEEALKDPAGQDLFLKFLESEFSSENLRWAKRVGTFSHFILAFIPTSHIVL